MTTKNGTIVLTEAVRKSVVQLSDTCGFDKSESASEDFVFALDKAVQVVKKAIVESNHSGLCYDGHTALAHALVDQWV